MDCKKALTETGATSRRPIDVLRKKGLAAAAKKAGRVDRRGRRRLVHPRRRQDRRAGRGQLRDRLRRPHREFQELVRDIAMHIAAADPQFVAPRGRAAGRARARARDLPRRRLAATGKPGATSSRRSSRASWRSSTPRRASSSSRSSRTPTRRSASSSPRRSRRSARTSRCAASPASSSARASRSAPTTSPPRSTAAAPMRPEIGRPIDASDARAYQRILLKLSGEALMGEPAVRHRPRRWSPPSPTRSARSTRLGVQMAIVIGGGNIFRGLARQRTRHGPRRPATTWACSPR